MATTGTGFPPKPPSLVIKEEKGRGSYGTVCVGKLEGKPVMIKRIHAVLLETNSDQRRNLVRNFEKECQILETLHHPNIVRSLGAYWDSATKEPLLLMEPMKENLREYLQRKKHAADKLSLDDHMSISLSIAEGLKFLHGQKQPIAHRDLNDKNILVGEDGSIKIGDLGQSALLAGSTDYMATLAPGAFVFMPPEALIEEPHYNLKVDSFSMGVLMLEISTQMPPPPRMANIGSSQEVDRRRKDLDLLDSGHPLKPIIVWCLQNQYQLRPDVATIHSQLMALKHPELQRRVEQLETRLRLKESRSLQLEEILRKLTQELQALKGDNRNLQAELQKTKQKLTGRELELEEQSLAVEQFKNENFLLQKKLAAAHTCEAQLLLQLRLKERVLVEKQTLQKELDRQLREKDKEIAVLNSDSEAKARCARDSLRRLQDVPKFQDSIKAAVTAVSSVVETLEENCAEMNNREKAMGDSTTKVTEGEGAMSDSRCVDALYCMPMPETENEYKAKAHLQHKLRGPRQREDVPVIEVRTLTRCGTSQQALVVLEALRSPADVTTIVEKQKGDMDFKLLMKEESTVRFTSPETDCDLLSTAVAILEADPDLSDCNVVVSSDVGKNAVSIIGSWHAVSHLRSRLVAVFCAAIEEEQALTGDRVQLLVDKAVYMDYIQAESIEGFTSTTKTAQSTMDAPNSKEDGTIVPESDSRAVDVFPGLNPPLVLLMQRLKLFDPAYIKCSEDFTTVSVVGEEEPAKRAGDAFITEYQDLVMDKKMIMETVFTASKLPEDQYVLLLSELENQHPEVLCQPQYPQQSMILLFALEPSKLLKAKQHIVSYSPGRQLPTVPPRHSHTTPQRR